MAHEVWLWTMLANTHCLHCLNAGYGYLQDGELVRRRDLFHFLKDGNEALYVPWAGQGIKRGVCTSNGKLVNFGNADVNGANVNDWNPKDRSANDGFFLSRSVR